MTAARELEIYIDGASKGNPGPAGIGVIILSSGQVIRNISVYLGRATNNHAEYTALIHALQEAVLLKAEKVVINTDSELVCRQINGLYKVRNAEIMALYLQAKGLFPAFKEVSVNHIPREKNKGADKLANQAVQQAMNAG